jgi:hypothetical protein
MNGKKKRNGRRKRRVSVRTGSWTLLIIDDAPIRLRALKEYHSAEKSVARIRTEMEAFETRDLPAFHRWEASRFGSMLTEIREMESAAAQKRHILDAIEEEMFWTECSRLTAYRRVMGMLKSPAPEAEDEDDPGPDAAAEKMFGDSDLPPGFDFEDYNRMSRAAKEEFRDFYEGISAMYEAMTGKRAPDLDEVLEREHNASRRGDARAPGGAPRRPAAPAPQPAHGDERIKSLYRRLARQLHPDANPDHGWRERELWHEVQAAYHARDLERLEAAAGHVDISLNGASPSLPVHLLQRMARDLRSTLHSLKKQARAARRHPAWSFPAEAEKLIGQESLRRKALEAEKRRIAAELAGLTADLAALAALAAQAARPRKPRGPRKRPAADHSGQMSFL